MEINITETGYCQVNVLYEADVDQIEKKRNEVALQFKNLPVKGWRPGKANIEVIKIHYRNQINEALKRALAEEAFHKTVVEKSIQPFGVPDFKNITLLSNKFTCEFSMHKKPEFDLAPYKGLEFPKQDIGFTTVELVQKFLQEARIRYGESVPFTEDDFVQTTDNIIIDYKAYEVKDGGTEVELSNLGATGELLTVGKSMLNGFDDNLLGMKVGESRKFNIRIPDNGLPSVAGKTVAFDVSLMLGSKVQPMPLNDDLAKKMEKETLTELETFMSEMATAKVAEAQYAAQINQIAAKLTADNNFKVPDWLVLSEAQYLAYSAGLQWDKVNDEDKNSYLALAEKNVKLALVLDKIRGEEIETQLSDHEVLDMIKTTLSKTSTDPDESLKKMNQNGYLNILVNRIRDEYVLDFIFKNSKIVE